MSKILRKIIKKNRFAVLIYKIYVKLSGKFRCFKNRLFGSIYTEEDLFKEFSRLGISPKDKIVVNSSMSRIGLLKDGPMTFIKALQKYITYEGLIVMPTYPHRGSYQYLTNYTIFDVNTTPSMNGSITEYFRKSNDVYRSIHPTHPLSAWGAGAKELMSGHEKSKSMYDKYSPYKKLLDLDVKNFLVGVNFDHMIMIRVIDDLYEEYPINPYCDHKFFVHVKGYKGEIINVETTCHDPNYFGKERENMKLYPYLKDKITYGKLGGATTWVLSSKEMYNTQVKCAKKQIFTFNKLRFKNENL